MFKILAFVQTSLSVLSMFIFLFNPTNNNYGVHTNYSESYTQFDENY